MKSKPEARPPSIKDEKIKQETASGSADQRTYKETVKKQIPDPKARPPAPPPSIRNLKRKLETEPPDLGRNIKTKEERVEPAIWDRMTVIEIRQQLRLRGFTENETQNGSIMRKADYLSMLKSML